MRLRRKFYVFSSNDFKNVSRIISTKIQNLAPFRDVTTRPDKSRWERKHRLSHRWSKSCQRSFIFFCQKEQKLGGIIFVKIFVSWRQTNSKKVVLLPSVGLGTFPGLGFRVSTFFPLILLSILGWTSPRRCCFDGEAFSSSEQKLLLLWSSSSSISKLKSVRFFWPENDPRPITSKCTTAWSTAGSASPRTRTSRWTTPPTPSTSRHRSPTSPPRINTLGDNFFTGAKVLIASLQQCLSAGFELQSLKTLVHCLSTL